MIKESKGAVSAGFEPDSLAGITSFAIPPKMCDDVTFFTTLLYLKQGNG
jgi:hypothetical protein